MKKIKNHLSFILLIPVLAGWFISCSPMDEYLDKYTNGKEIQYPGIVFPASMYSGKDRVVFNGYLMSDPKITKLKILWNSDQDSLVQSIQRSEDVDTLFIPIDLPEGGYNFDVYTYDNEGNRSIPVVLTATSYGHSYQSSLLDRVVKSVDKTGSDVTIEWYSVDPTSPFVEITYPTESGADKIVRLTQDSSKIVLEDFKAKSCFKMQTFYLPDEMSIDTFYTAPTLVAVNEDITHDYLLNPGLPFLRGDDGTDKWGTPKDWLYTDNVLNQNNDTKGGWSSNGNPGGVIQFESRNYSGDGITNGKIYQTIELPAGKYAFEAYSSISSTVKNSFLDVALVAATGNELPDMEQLTSNALGYYSRQVSNGAETYRFEFDVTEKQDITLGWVASFGKTSSIQFTYVKLFYIPQQ